MTNEYYNNYIAQLLAKKERTKEQKMMDNNNVSVETAKKMDDERHNWFCSQRTFYEHNQPLEDYVEPDTVNDDSAAVDKFVELITSYEEVEKQNPYKWIETLENTEAMQYLSDLDEESKYIITAITQQQRDIVGIAKDLKTTRQRVSRKYKKIIEPLREMYAFEYEKCERRHLMREVDKLSKKKKNTASSESNSDELLNVEKRRLLREEESEDQKSD